ncbi:MAG: 16S rRNA (cytosine(1402)-N(4))-methyltransferase RsmH [Thiobacillus sp.]|uniref:16S rRNA (cytosine(1402)-N(4))-methyltransferase RsmH n=1 Tax=Thiobacillus sp. TaxID=924 RepID=UPI002732B6F2|nr:16S rRNA (cytosine(1402)-N(4))-methyltransferase RsmH [Thiobacillus sp.]MDP3585100.1 16S rRNA (cytosine(1402)-N(4))-methyltransferase RsmH [Thiobacillus sp.]
MTPAHVPVLAQEAVAALAIRPDGVYVDATFGRGGHSRLILAQLGPAGRLIALDRDPDAIRAGAALQDGRLMLVKRAFSALGAVLDERGVAQVDGILLDIGVSSPQIDDAARGFSFRADAPLDMRMDPESGLSAADWLATAAEGEICEVIRTYGEERFAKSIARAIVAARQEDAIRSTGQLAKLIAATVKRHEPGQHPATRSFQAIRIYINRELEELSAVLPQCVDRLQPGGRLAVISFHSLEDRIVKRFMRDEAMGEQPPRRLPIPAAMLKPGRLKLVGRAQHANDAEVAVNPRARSAVLRVAERVSAAEAGAR